MQVKTCPVTVKTAGSHEGVEEGVFEAIVAAYNVDSVGDRIIPGAFGKSLAQWKDSGNPIPVLWAHKSDDPDYHIGEVIDAEERPEGLWVKARVDIDDPRSKSAQVYRLLKGRRVTQFSFAYDEVDARPAQKDDSGATKDLHELKVYEVGPCLIGANQSTSLMDVKHDVHAAAVLGTFAEGVRTAVEQAVEQAPATKDSGHPTGEKAGRVLSKRNEELVETIHRLASELLDSVKKAEPATPEASEEETEGSNAEKATPGQPATDPAPAEAKSSEPARHGTASSERLRTDLALAFLEAEVVPFTSEETL